MINLTAIAANIQRRLFEKMNVLGRDPNKQTTTPNKQKTKDTDVGLTHAKMATRSTFIKMCSGQVNPVVLEGGKLKDNNNVPGGYDEIYGPRTYHTPTIDGELISAEDMQDIGYFYTEKRTFENKYKRPMPGVKSADISFKGGVRALREATVQWTCWDWEELNILMPHFLAHGKTVLLEWGWVYESADNPVWAQRTFIKINDSGEPYLDANAYSAAYKNDVIDADGDFDMMVGIIKNFEFTTRDDGGFDCTTTITSVGASILDNPEPNDVALDPGIVYNTSFTEDSLDLAKKISNATGKKGVYKAGFKKIPSNVSPKLRAEEQDSLVDLNTTLSLKLFIKEIDRYIFEKLEPRFGEGKSIYVEPNKYMVAFGSPNGDDKNTTTGFESYDSFGPAKVNANLGGYWVRWGWFEDNVLSKFLSMITQPELQGPINPKDIKVLTQFRSIENILNTEGKTTGEYESVLIKNHADLQTTNINNHILPGQFYPVGAKPYVTPAGKEKNIPGDPKYLQDLATEIENGFDNFTTGNDVITVSEKIYKDVDIMKDVFGDFTPEKKKVGTKQVYTGKTQEKERLVPGKYGYLRNMLINTKVIKDAFGVSDNFNIESINIVESLESLFSILNRELNFWNFSVVTDETETHRAKIIDNQIVNFNFNQGESVTSQKTLEEGGSLFTENSFEPGVFFFPVWQQDSMVKRQNITAKIPNELQLSIMYGTNLDQLKDFANPGAAFGNKEGVFAGALFNGYADIKNKGMDIAFRSDMSNIGTPDGNPNDKLTTGGDDIRTFIKKNSGEIESKLEDRLTEINKELELASEKDLYDGLNFDAAIPPPVLKNLNPQQLGELLEYERGVLGPKSPVGKLLGSQFDDTGNMRPVFKKSVGFLTTQHGIYKNSKTPLLIPLELELDIDGIGGIYPGNSCHSTYVPAKYQNTTVFQIFDVNHRVGNEGWTVTLACKMRSTLDNVITGFATTDELRQQQLANYIDKAQVDERKRLSKAEKRRQKRDIKVTTARLAGGG